MESQWFHDEEFSVPLPDWLADDIACFYGTHQTGIDFAQALAEWLNVRDFVVAKAHTIQPNVFTSNTRS